MSRKLLGCGFACAISGIAIVHAQNPPQTRAPQTPASAASASAQPAIVTVEGCVMKEVDAPARNPPEALRQRAEADDDYVLTETKRIKGTPPSPGGRTRETPVGTSGTTSSSALYEIKGLEKGQLREHVGYRVQIEGTLEHPERAANPVAFANDLVDLRATVIRRVEGSCPSK
jgi:hypothetical protein